MVLPTTYFSIPSSDLKPQYKNFAQYLKQMRKKANISTRELSSQINKSPSYISHLENNRIKSIDYYIAHNLFKYINDKTYLILGKIDNEKILDVTLENFLSENFNILSPKLLEIKIQEQKRREAQQLEEYEEITHIISKLEFIMYSSDNYLKGYYLRLFKSLIDIIEQSEQREQTEVLENILGEILENIINKERRQ